LRALLRREPHRLGPDRSGHGETSGRKSGLGTSLRYDTNEHVALVGRRSAIVVR